MDGLRLIGFSPSVSVVYPLATSGGPGFIPSKFGTSPSILKGAPLASSKKKQLRRNLNCLQSWLKQIYWFTNWRPAFHRKNCNLPHSRSEVLLGSAFNFSFNTFYWFCDIQYKFRSQVDFLWTPLEHHENVAFAICLNSCYFLIIAEVRILVPQPLIQ